METLISPVDVVGKDPFGRFLAKIKIKPWQAGLLSLSWFLIYTLLLPALFGVLFPRIGLERNSIDDRVNQVGFWVVHPIVIFFYLFKKFKSSFHNTIQVKSPNIFLICFKP